MNKIKVPDGWKIQKLGETTEVINGRAYKLSEWEKFGIPVIRLQNLTQRGGNFYYSTLELPEKQYCQKGDLLFMWSASFGPYLWWGDKAIYHYHIWKMVPKAESVDKQFLYFYLEQKTDEWKKNTSGMAMLHLTKKGIEKTDLTIPPLPEQQKIASILTSVDDVIEKIQSQINKLQDLKEGTMNELLTRGIGHTEFKDSPVGKIPKEWEVFLLDQIATKITDGEHQTPKRSNDGFYLLSARNIQNGFISLDNVDYIPESEYKRINKRVCPRENDILISCSGSVGRCALVPKGLQFSMVRSVAIVQLIDEVCVPSFLFQAISSPFVQDQIKKMLSQQAQANLFQSHIKSIKVILPSIPEQLKIASILSSIDKTIEEKQRKLEQTKNLKKSLMQDLLTGKVRVQV